MTPIEYVSAIIVVAVIAISLQWQQHRMSFFEWLVFRRKVKYKLTAEKRERKTASKNERAAWKIQNRADRLERKRILKAERVEKKRDSIWSKFTLKSKIYLGFLTGFFVLIASGLSVHNIGGRRDYLIIFAVGAVLIIIFEMAIDSIEKPRKTGIKAAYERIPDHQKPEVLRLIRKHAEEIEDRREDG